MDCSHRGTIFITGKDRREFLNRMLTQELKDLTPGVAKESFWLNRKGRIEADLLLVDQDDLTVMDLDICQAASAAKTLQGFVFTEDVEINDASSAYLHVGVHGPMAGDVLARLVGLSKFSLDPLHGAKLSVNNQADVTIIRRDQTGVPGYELIIAIAQAPLIWNALLATDRSIGESRRRIRPIGWHAFNIARIEAGTPLMNIDFGTTNLPHETGVLKSRLSFTKGCYLGQEVVARMESLGQPKQRLVGLRMDEDKLPVAGSQVFARREDGSMDQQIGAVTSSTLSPMLGATPIAFAMIRSSHAATGTRVLVNAEGEQALAMINSLNMLEGDSTVRSSTESGAPRDV
jgi:folate-binding protein YgfZ